MILTVTANPAVDKVYFVDEFIMGNVYRPKSMVASAGGKGLNVTRVASILGQPVIAMGFLGGGASSFIQKEVEKLGAIPCFTTVCGETRTCINISNSSGVSGEILEPGPNITPAENKSFLELFDKKVDLCDVVCVSGSLPNGLDSEFYNKLINKCVKKGKPIIVDTSGQTLIDVIDKSPFMIKPNSDEIVSLFGNTLDNKNDMKNVLYLLKKKGIAVPLITLGKDGAIAMVEDKYYHYNMPDVSVKNSVGSGDSTVAGIAVGICKGLSFLDAVKLGMACGIANTQFEQTGMVSEDLVKKFYNQILVEVI